MTDGDRARKAMAIGFQSRLGKSVHEFVGIDATRAVFEVADMSVALNKSAELAYCNLIIACLDSASLHDLHFMQQLRETCPRVTLIALFDVQQDIALAHQTVSSLLIEFLQCGGTGSNSASASSESSGSTATQNEQKVTPESLGYSLTTRQREVLILIGEGKSNKEIARVLDLSDGTVKLHCMAIFRALNVSNRTQAAILSRELELKGPPAKRHILSSASN